MANIIHRHRRLRQSPWIRELVQEARLHPSDLILPLFVHDGEPEAIPTLPGVSRHSLKSVVAAAKEAAKFGIPAIALFPVTPANKKDAKGSEALNQDNLACRAIAEIKSAVPEIGIIADVALDPYTSHGHDGVLDAKGDVANDATVEILAKQAVVLAKAGADVVAPSDMMDGRVAAIREALEVENFTNTMILAYAAKYASALYGPFRDAVGSAKSTPLDKRSYQMNPANAQEAMSEIAQDIAEGADMVMVKPATLYLDIIAKVAANFDQPILAYHVSGEYAMAKAMPGGDAIVMEQLLAIKRAGARGILTYAAVDVIKSLR